MKYSSDFISDYKTTNKQKYDGTKTFICPNCRAGNPIKFKAKIKIFNEECVYPDLYLNLECANCGKEFKQSVDDAIDPEIAYAIITLNSKGYKTAFSCQGHIRKNNSWESAYIKFASKLPKEAIDKLPFGWNVEEDEYCTTIRCMELEEYPLDKRITLLNNWVDSLPNRDEKVIDDNFDLQDLIVSI